jgi:hypothetical protein
MGILRDPFFYLNTNKKIKTLATSTFSNQIQNRNFLSPVGFKFTLAKEPKVSYFCNSAVIPEITLGVAKQPSYLKNLDVPGEILTYGDFSLKFLVDENMENYMIIHNWLTGLGFPETAEQYKNLTTNDQEVRDSKQAFSDGSLHILNSNYRDIAIVKFRDLFPVALSSLEFDATPIDTIFLSARVTFKYTIYDILGTDGKPL